MDVWLQLGFGAASGLLVNSRKSQSNCSYEAQVPVGKNLSREWWIYERTEEKTGDGQVDKSFTSVSSDL